MKFVDPWTVHDVHWLAEKKWEKSNFATIVHWTVYEQ